jgi:hypothetical protein
MRRTAISVLLLLLCLASAAVGSDADSLQTISAAGLIQFDPPQERACVAVRVRVPEDKMITGLKWWNGTSQRALPKVLIASGAGFFPPPYSEAVDVADSVLGETQGWSTVEFATPVASETGTLFVVVEYPAYYAPPTEGPVLGVGYAAAEAKYVHFITGDGENWNRVASPCRVLVEPVLADRTRGVVSLRIGARGDVSDPKARLGLYTAPNPFNPETHIDLSLPVATSGSVKVMDLRGCLVAELHQGELKKGENSFVWRGRDRSDKPVASGVYWILAQTDDERFVKKVLLVK